MLADAYSDSTIPPARSPTDFAPIHTIGRPYSIWRRRPIAQPERQPASYRLVDDRTDEQLLEDYRSGDTAAFRVLIERYHDDLLRFLNRFMGSRQAAEDVFQEAFLQVHQSAESFDTSRRFKPWLFTIAANKGRDMHRKSARRPALGLSAEIGEQGSARFVDLMEIDVPDPSDRMATEDRDRLVQQAIDELTDAQREILLLAYFQKLSYQQVSDLLGIPLGTVKSRLHGAVAAFARSYKAILEQSGGGPNSEDSAS